MIALLVTLLLLGGGSDAGPETTRFAVEVNDQGHTQVISTSGKPIRVESQGRERTLVPGQILRVDAEKPKPPKLAHPSFDAKESPALLAPESLEKLRFPAADHLLGPVQLSWQRVANASAYEVEVTRQAPYASALTFRVSQNQSKLPLLQEGGYRWTVRAIGPLGERGAAAAPRVFFLSKDSVRLDVQSTEWK